ncbi:unnamed protein product [Acanthosepion pharaonis]|uniref:Uncharacterized protein n=1 Tax=Acanthosepion pharaonis TaxID=158019 RepID=A0A812DNJ5_ACAPH|nr:unnamed protein product [Sepia pharaonis]
MASRAAGTIIEQRLHRIGLEQPDPHIRQTAPDGGRIATRLGIAAHAGDEAVEQRVDPYRDAQRLGAAQDRGQGGDRQHRQFDGDRLDRPRICWSMIRGYIHRVRIGGDQDRCERHAVIGAMAASGTEATRRRSSITRSCAPARLRTIRSWRAPEFVERLDTLVRDRGRRATFRPDAAEAPSTARGQVGDLAGSVGRPIDALVMHDDEMTVGCAAHRFPSHRPPQRHALH